MATKKQEKTDIIPGHEFWLAYMLKYLARPKLPRKNWGKTFVLKAHIMPAPGKWDDPNKGRAICFGLDMVFCRINFIIPVPNGTGNSKEEEGVAYFEVGGPSD